MQITYIPQSRFDSCEVSADGDILTIGGARYDFSPLPEGATLPREAVACKWLVSDVERIDGEIHLTLIRPVGPQTEDPA
ncbi:MAG TPA: hypothetical protein DEA05_08295 [Rhodobacteraceae bacterium]|nr:hypothetical protein [Paracoccaceae bacterium]